MNQRHPGIDALPPEQRLLLARHLRSRRGAEGGESIPRREGLGPCPLSFSQQRLWFLDQLDPGNSAYNVYRAARLTGDLDRAALEKSFAELVRRHETLRTTFRVANGAPVQVVSEPGAVPLPVTDLSGLAADAREAEVLRRANEEAERPFDLGRGDPLLRTALLRLGPREHVLLVTTHHIAADGWSVGILFSDLGALYEAFASGGPSPLPPTPIHYTDYACWQRRGAEGPPLARQLEYWKRQLAGSPACLELPTDRPRPAALRLKNFRGARHYFLMPRALLDGLTALSRQENATLFMTLLAATKVLLCRHTGQQDILVGSPMAGRNRPEVEGLIGCFSNTLVLRDSLAGNPTFRELLARVRETALAAFANAETPFEKLVEELRPPRVPNRMVLFQVNFRLLTAPPPPPRLAGLDLQFLEIDNHMAKFDLAFELCARPDGLGGYVEYLTDLFEPATIQRLVGELEEVLGTAVARPDIPLSELTGRRPVTRSLTPMNEPKLENKQSKGLRSVRRQAVDIAGAPDAGRPPQSDAPKGHAAPDEGPSYTLRKATMKDCDFIYRLRAEGLGPYVSRFPGWSVEQQEAYYLDFDPAVHWIIVVDGQDVGDLGVIRTDEYIDALGVHLLPEVRGKWLGSKVLKDLFKEGDAKGIPVKARVIKTNPALKLWLRIGFVITGEKEHHYEITYGEIRSPTCVAGSPEPAAEPPRRGPEIRAIRRKGIDLGAQAPPSPAPARGRPGGAR